MKVSRITESFDRLCLFSSFFSLWKKKVLLAGLVAACSAGLIPAAVPAAVPAAFAAAPVPAALTVGTYATSYNAHAVNHAVAAPYIASPVIAHAAPLAYSSLPAAALVAGRR